MLKNRSYRREPRAQKNRGKSKSRRGHFREFWYDVYRRLTDLIDQGNVTWNDIKVHIYQSHLSAAWRILTRMIKKHLVTAFTLEATVQMDNGQVQYFSRNWEHSGSLPPLAELL